MKTQWRARASLAGLGALGIAVGHRVAYFMVTSDPHARHELLESTGHTYWPLAGALLVAMIVGTIGVSISSRLHRSRSGASTLATNALVLAGLQVSGFILMEAGERLLFASQHHVTSLLSEPVLWIGIALQVIVAVVGALVLRFLLRAVEFVQALLRASFHEQAQLPLARPLCSQIIAPRLSPGAGGTSRRGPPLLALI